MSERPIQLKVNQSDKAQVREKISRGQEFTIERYKKKIIKINL
jgi:hypothetical protein